VVFFQRDKKEKSSPETGGEPPSHKNGVKTQHQQQTLKGTFFFHEKEIVKEREIFFLYTIFREFKKTKIRQFVKYGLSLKTLSARMAKIYPQGKVERKKKFLNLIVLSLVFF